MSRQTLFTAVALTFAGAVAGVGRSAKDVTPSIFTSSAAALGVSNVSAAVPFEKSHCAGCTTCEDPHFIATAIVSDPDKEWLVSFYCNQPFGGSCSELPSCGGRVAPLVDDLDRAVAAGNDEELTAIIAQHPAEVVVVPERSALQVMDCTGKQVVTQIQLSAAALSALLPTKP